MKFRTKVMTGVLFLILVLGVLFAIPTGLTSLAGSAMVAVILVGMLIKRVVF